MNKEYFDSMNEMGRQAFEFGRQLADINLRAMDRLTTAQVQLWSESVEKSLAQSQKLAEAKGYKDVLEVQAETARELTQAAVAHGRESVELLTGTRDELMKAYQTGFEQAAKEVQKAAPKKAA